MDDSLHLQPFLAQLACQAGKLALSMQSQLQEGDVSCKATVRDIVTAADQATERFIRQAVEKRFPHHRFYGEETGRSQDNGNPYCWIVDPIDGTVSYYEGQLYWCTSIALWKDGKPLAGAVYAPALDELYYGEAGKGAFCNGRPIHVRSHGSLEQSVLSTGFSCLRAGWTEGNNVPFFAQIGLHCRGVRRFGSAAMDICYVACGKSDGFWELNLQPYDYAAAMVVLLEAGGQVTDLGGGGEYPRQGILATNGAIHQEMLRFFPNYSRLRD